MIVNKSRSQNDKMELQIAPLIDVVFLLLIYFIMAAQLIRKEGDIQFVLPASVTAPKPIDIPVEVVVLIEESGTVEVDGMRFSADDEMLTEFANHLRGLRVMAAGQDSKFFVNLLPDKQADYERIINVMDACAAAEVEGLTFSESM